MHTLAALPAPQRVPARRSRPAADALHAYYIADADLPGAACASDHGSAYDLTTDFCPCPCRGICSHRWLLAPARESIAIARHWLADLPTVLRDHPGGSPPLIDITVRRLADGRGFPAHCPRAGCPSGLLLDVCGYVPGVAYTGRLVVCPVCEGVTL